MSECIKKMNESAKNRPSTSSQNSNVLPCGRAVQQTVTYVSRKNVQNGNHAASKVTHLWPDSLVIMDIMSKLNDKDGKHGVRIFDNIPNQTRRDGESDCDQVIPKDVYDEIMNRNDDKGLFAENDLVFVDNDSLKVVYKTGKLKPVGYKESKCRTCPSAGDLPAINQSNVSSSDGEKPPEKKRKKKILKRSRTPYTPEMQSSGSSSEKTTSIYKSESSSKRHATKNRSRNSSHSRERVKSRSASCAFSCRSRRSSKRRKDRRRSRRRRSRLSSSSSGSSSSSTEGSCRSSRYRSRSRRRRHSRDTYSSSRSRSRSRSPSRSRNHSRRSHKRYRDKHRDRDKDKRRCDVPSRSQSHRSKGHSSSRHRSLKRSRTKSPEKITSKSTSIQTNPKENKSKSDVTPSHSLHGNPRPTTPFYHNPPERPFCYGNQHADPHMFPRYPYPNFIPHPPMPMPQPGPSHYFSAMNHPYAMNPYMPNVYKIYRKRNKSNLPSKSDNNANDDQKKDV